MNRIAISDIHLGRGEADEFCFDQELARFLEHSADHLAPLELILNGDIFDLIAVEEEGDLAQILEEISHEHAAVFAAFRRIAREGRVVLIPGNHDHHLRDQTISEIVKTLIPNVYVATEGVYRVKEENGVFYHFEHGDLYDPWSSIISPQNGQSPKTNLIVKDLIQEFFHHPIRILRHKPSGAAALALEKVIKKVNLAPHEHKLFHERLIPLIKKFKVNAQVFWRLANSLSVRKIKKFGKLYVDIVGAEIAHGEEPYYRDAAKKIAQKVGAPLSIVSFGHTHKPEVIYFDNGVLYSNSGTWGHDISKSEDKQFHEVKKGTYLLFTPETIKTKEGILNYFIPPTKRRVL